MNIRKGMVQDATFIVAELSHANQEKLRGSVARTRIIRKRTLSKKHGRPYFGYKLYSIIDK